MTDPSIPPTHREFRCPHCNGKIRIPKDLPATTGPCPICQTVITSPSPDEETPAGSLPPVPTRSETPDPLPAAPAPAPIPLQPVPAAAAPRTSFENLVGANPSPASRAAAAPAQKPAEKKNIAAIIFLILVVALLGAALFYFISKGKIPLGPKPKPAVVTAPVVSSEITDARYARTGWQKDAYALLEKFIAGKTAAEKLPFILNAKELQPQVEAFYAKNPPSDLNTPPDTFSINQLSEDDRNRGIFMLIFDQPPQFDIKDFFRPLAPLEVQYGVSEANILLSTVARIENFSTQPVRAAAFFKRTPQGLKLDWETFIQTKYRTLESFSESPEAGKSGIFRVIIAQDVPDSRAEDPGAKTYRLSDPVSPEINTRIKVNIDSEIGKILSEINWIGERGVPVNRTATLDLKWSEEDKPQLMVRFVCWEFLHLGAEEAADAAAPTPSPAPAPPSR